MADGLLIKKNTPEIVDMAFTLRVTNIYYFASRREMLLTIKYKTAIS
jgi:hypothetical protein